VPKIIGKTYTKDHGIPRREVAALSAYFLLYFGGVGFNITFLPIFLKSRGLSLSEMAILWAIAATFRVMSAITVLAFVLLAAFVREPVSHRSA